METMEKISVSDLSVGDWVCAEQLCGVHSEPRLTPPMKVVGLGESWVNLEIEPEQGDPFEFEPSEIRGVPITAEVLEKNGWQKSEIDKTMILEICKGQNIGISNTVYGHNFIAVYCALGQCYEVSNMPIRYVHELQHCLRILRTEKEITL